MPLIYVLYTLQATMRSSGGLTIACTVKKGLNWVEGKQGKVAVYKRARKNMCRDRSP